MIRRCGARSVASLGTETQSPGLRLTHCPAFKEAVQLQLPTGQDLYSRGFLPLDFNLLQTCRAPVLAIDPPPHAPALPFKMALVSPCNTRLTKIFVYSHEQINFYLLSKRWATFHSHTQRMEVNCILPTWESPRMSIKR